MRKLRVTRANKVHRPKTWYDRKKDKNLLEKELDDKIAVWRKELLEQQEDHEQAMKEIQDRISRIKGITYNANTNSTNDSNSDSCKRIIHKSAVHRCQEVMS